MHTTVKSRAKLPSNLQPHVNCHANAVFTIFAFHFPLVFTFLHYICPEVNFCKSNFSCSESSADRQRVCKRLLVHGLNFAIRYCQQLIQATSRRCMIGIKQALDPTKKTAAPLKSVHPGSSAPLDLSARTWRALCSLTVQHQTPSIFEVKWRRDASSPRPYLGFSSLSYWNKHLGMQQRDSTSRPGQTESSATSPD